MREPETTLQPFDPADAAVVAAWAESAEEAWSWCSSTSAPVPAETVAGWGRAEGVLPHVLREGERLVAYGELWVDDEEREVELARLIVEPERRGRGVGRRLVSLLAARAGRIHARVVLRVHAENEIAMRCYAAAGFRRATPVEEERWNRNQPLPYVWMRRERASSA